LKKISTYTTILAHTITKEQSVVPVTDIEKRLNLRDRTQAAILANTFLQFLDDDNLS
jgi:hypothetical protein